MSAPRVLLSCVAEDAPSFHARVESLVGSARRLGGSALAEAAVVVNAVGSAEQEFVARMSALDAEVRVVARMSQRGAPHANKLRMLELGDRDDFDVLLAVDCDIAVAADPIPHLQSEAIAVVPADVDPLSERQWQRIFAGLGIEAGLRSVCATTTGRPMYPYFNSGVVAVPRHLCAALLAGWTRALNDLDRLWERQPNIVPRAKRFFADQFALMAALARELPYTVASRELNFATHVALDPATVEGLEPALLHYHSAVDADGFLLRPRCAVAAAAAERFNRDRARSLDRPYHGLQSGPTPGYADRLFQAAKAPARQLLRR